MRDSIEGHRASVGVQRVMPADQFLSELEFIDGPEAAQRQHRAILVHSSGLAYSLIGTARVNGQIMVQLLRGSRVLPLVSRDELISVGFKSVWTFRDRGSGIPFRVGRTDFQVDKLFHNFGKIENAQRLTCSFALKNRGEQALLIGKPQVSCGCVTTDYDAELEVPSGEEWRIKVEIQSSNSELMQHQIIIPITEESSGSTRDIAFSLIGFTPQLIGVTPRVLDFGTLDSNGLSERQVRITESRTDRIDSIDVQVNGLPVSNVIDEVVSLGGLKSYRLLVRCNGRDLEPGQNEGSFAIQAPLVNGEAGQPVFIPTKASLSPLFWLEPGTLGFGVISLGREATRRVRVECFEEAIIEEIRVVDSPAECKVEISEASEKASKEVIVQIMPTTKGVWSGRVSMLVRAAGDSATRKLYLTCVSEVE